MQKALYLHAKTLFMNHFLLIFRILPLVFLSLIMMPAQAAKKTQPDLIRVVDKAAGIDTAFMQVKLVTENLYTDSLRVGIRHNEEGPVEQWFDQSQIEFFVLDEVVYEPRTLVMDDGSQHRLLMQRDRGRKGSNALIYTLGANGNKQFYIRRRSDEQLHQLASTDGQFSNYANTYLADLWSNPTAKAAEYVAHTKATRRHFRLAERIYRQQNDHYLRHFTYGGLAGIHLTNIATNGHGDINGQLCVTAGIWADLPLDTWGFSLRAEASYYAFSSMLTHAKNSFAYNHRSIDIPLLLRYTALPVKGRIMPYLEGGVSMGIRLSSDCKGEIYMPDHDGDYYFFWNGESTESPYNILAGAGAEVQLTRNHSLGIGLRYRLSGPLDKMGSQHAPNSTIQETLIDIDRSGWMLSFTFNL